MKGFFFYAALKYSVLLASSIFKTSNHRYFITNLVAFNSFFTTLGTVNKFETPAPISHGEIAI